MSRSQGEGKRGGCSRRGFLSGALQLSAAGLLAGQAEPAEAAASYRVTGWSGDESNPLHRFRDGWLPREPKTWKKHEVVVIGGGISGMSAAFKLRQTDLLVLETGSSLGGNARSSRYRGWEFNIGSAYIVGIEGEQGKLWSELGIKLTPCPHPLDRWHYRGQWINDPWRDDSMGKLPDGFRKAMQGAKKAFTAVSNGKDFPLNPYQQATPRALALDKISFAEWLKPYAHPDLMAYVDAYCYSAMGGPASMVSAYGGINFYVDILDERAYAWTEGNQHLIRAMVSQVERAGAGRIRPGCSVYKVVPVSPDLCRVYYLQGGEAHAVEAKKVVLAVPFFVASRLIEGLAPGQKYALGCQSYGAYLVGNLCFDRVITREAYDSWAPSVDNFEDYIPVGWPDPEGSKEKLARDGQIIGAFAGSHYPVLTRVRMLTQKPETFAHRIVDSFEKVHPGSRQHLREVHMTRWGHAFIINRPGMYTRWLPAIKKQIGPIHLAHADGQGLPAVEASTTEAVTAAYAILAGWKKK